LTTAAHWGMIGMPDYLIIGRKDGMRKGSAVETSKVGKRGAVVIPARLRRRFGLQEGALVIAEARSDGILLRPAVALPVETYSPERVAEFLLSNAVDAREYARAVARVKRMGLDPKTIPHARPR
jgi:AbrB family looped-hinge helix DNA binding protein